MATRHREAGLALARVAAGASAGAEGRAAGVEAAEGQGAGVEEQNQKRRPEMSGLECWLELRLETEIKQSAKDVEAADELRPEGSKKLINTNKPR